MSQPHTTLMAYWRLLRGNRRYRLLWTAQVVSEVGDWQYSLAIYSLLLSLTHRAEAVALAVSMQLLPQVFVGPLAGVINDRLPRRRVMISSDLVRVVVVLGMLWAGRGGHVLAIYFLLALETISWAFFEPARTAMVPNLVSGDDDTATATMLSSTTWSTNFAVGSALGGLVGVAFGFEAVFLLNAASFLLSAFCISRIEVHEPHAADRPPLHARELIDFQPYLDGFRYMRGNPRLLATMMVKAAFGALGVHWVIIPIFGERVFPVRLAGYTEAQAGLLGMSLLTTARGIGAILGPLVAYGWTRENQARMRTMIGLGFALLGLGYAGLSVSPNVWIACGALMILAMGASTAWTFATTLLQLQTEDQFRGRVFSADFSLLLLNMSVVSYLAGELVDRQVPVRAISLAVGVAAIIPVVLWGRAGRLWREPSALQETASSER